MIFVEADGLIMKIFWCDWKFCIFAFFAFFAFLHFCISAKMQKCKNAKNTKILYFHQIKIFQKSLGTIASGQIILIIDMMVVYQSGDQWCNPHFPCRISPNPRGWLRTKPGSVPLTEDEKTDESPLAAVPLVTISSVEEIVVCLERNELVGPGATV